MRTFQDVVFTLAEACYFAELVGDSWRLPVRLSYSPGMVWSGPFREQHNTYWRNGYLVLIQESDPNYRDRSVIRLAAEEDPWEAYVGKRGQRKGQHGWRNRRTKRIVYGNKPKGRNKDRPKVEHVVARVAEHLSGSHPVTAEHVREVADLVSQMTVKDVAELKRQLQVSASGASMAKKIAERALTAVQQEQEVEPRKYLDKTTHAAAGKEFATPEEAQKHLEETKEATRKYALERIKDYQRIVAGKPQDDGQALEALQKLKAAEGKEEKSVVQWMERRKLGADAQLYLAEQWAAGKAHMQGVALVLGDKPAARADKPKNPRSPAPPIKPKHPWLGGDVQHGQVYNAPVSDKDNAADNVGKSSAKPVPEGAEAAGFVPNTLRGATRAGVRLKPGEGFQRVNEHGDTELFTHDDVKTELMIARAAAKEAQARAESDAKTKAERDKKDAEERQQVEEILKQKQQQSEKLTESTTPATAAQTMPADYTQTVHDVLDELLHEQHQNDKNIPVEKLQQELASRYGDEAASMAKIKPALHELSRAGRAWVNAVDADGRMVDPHHVTLTEGTSLKQPRVRPSVLPPEEQQRLTTAIEKALPKLAIKHKDKKGNTALVPIHEIRDLVRAEFGDKHARHDAFDDVVMQMWRDGKLRPVSISDLQTAKGNQLNDSIPGVHETLFYLEVPTPQETIDNSTGRDKTSPEVSTKPSGDAPMSDKIHDQPFAMELSDYKEAYKEKMRVLTDAAETSGVDKGKAQKDARTKVAEQGFSGDWEKDVVKAVLDGKPVPQSIIDQLAPAVKMQFVVRMRTDLGDDYIDRVKAIAATPVHAVIRKNEDGSMTVRQKQLPKGDFHEHKKGDVVVVGGQPMIISKAKKPYRLKVDGYTWAYVQDIMLVEPKNQNDVKQAVLAMEAIGIYDGSPNNVSYPREKKRQMADHAIRVYLAMGKEPPADIVAEAENPPQEKIPQKTIDNSTGRDKISPEVSTKPSGESTMSDKIHGRTVAAGGKESGFVRAGKNAVRIGEVFRRNGQRYVVTTATSNYVSEDDIEDQDAWSQYPNGKGHYTHFTAIPVDDTAEERHADAAEAKKQQDHADAAEAKKRQEQDAWGVVSGSGYQSVETSSQPPGIPENTQWELVSDDTGGNKFGHGTRRYIATIGGGVKVGKIINTGYDDSRTIYSIPENLADEVTLQRAVNLGRDLDDNRRLAGSSDNYYQRDGAEMLAAYERATPERRAAFDLLVSSSKRVRSAAPEQAFDEVRRHYRETGNKIDRLWMPISARRQYDYLDYELRKRMEMAADDPYVMSVINSDPQMAKVLDEAIYSGDESKWDDYLAQAIPDAKTAVEKDRATKRDNWKSWYDANENAVRKAVESVLPADLVDDGMAYVRSQTYERTEPISNDDYKKPEKWARVIEDHLKDGNFTQEEHPRLHAHARKMRAEKNKPVAARKTANKDSYHAVSGNTYPHKETIKALGGRWKDGRWIIPASAVSRLPKGLRSSPIE